MGLWELPTVEEESAETVAALYERALGMKESVAADIMGH